MTWIAVRRLKIFKPIIDLNEKLNILKTISNRSLSYNIKAQKKKKSTHRSISGQKEKQKDRKRNDSKKSDRSRSDLHLRLLLLLLLLLPQWKAHKHVLMRSEKIWILLGEDFYARKKERMKERDSDNVLLFVRETK